VNSLHLFIFKSLPSHEGFHQNLQYAPDISMKSTPYPYGGAPSEQVVNATRLYQNGLLQVVVGDDFNVRRFLETYGDGDPLVDILVQMLEELYAG